jgi:hypothetical protein
MRGLRFKENYNLFKGLWVEICHLGPGLSGCRVCAGNHWTVACTSSLCDLEWSLCILTLLLCWSRGVLGQSSQKMHNKYGKLVRFISSQLWKLEIQDRGPAGAFSPETPFCGLQMPPSCCVLRWPCLYVYSLVSSLLIRPSVLSD